MPIYRVTIRYGQGPYRYHVEDVEAPGIGRALELAAEHLPREADAAGDVAEVRRLLQPEERGVAPG